MKKKIAAFTLSLSLVVLTAGFANVSTVLATTNPKSASVKIHAQNPYNPKQAIIKPMSEDPEP